MLRGEGGFEDGGEGVARVFETISKDIYGIIDDEESVMLFMGELDLVDWRVLAVMLLEVGVEGLCEAGMNCAVDFFCSFCENGECAFVAIIIYECDLFCCCTNEGGDIIPSIKYTSGWK